MEAPGASVSAESRPFSVEDANVGVRHARGGKSNESFGGPLLDISARGLRFISDKAHPPGSRLKVAVDFSAVSKVLTCEGIIRWAHPHAPPDQFAIGVEFDELDEEGQKTLRLVRQHEKSKTRGPRTALRHKEAISGGLVPPPIPDPDRPPSRPVPVAPRREAEQTAGSRGLSALLISLLVLVIAGIVVAAVLLNSGPENFHRFGTGSTWIYSVSSGEEASLWRVELVEDRGERGSVFRGSLPSEDPEEVDLGSEEFDYLVKKGYLVRRSSENRFYRIYRFDAAAGDSWETRPETAADLRTVHRGRGPVTVPAGTFEDSVTVRFTTFDRGEKEETLTLVPGVGVVLRETVHRDKGATIRRREELKEYTLVPAVKP